MTGKLNILVFALFLLNFLPFSISGQSAKYSNEFLNVGIGARSLGMSRAFIASADDVTAGYWNPAGMVSMQGRYQAALMHAQYFAGIAKFDYLGAGTRIDDRSALGISVLRYGVDDIPNTIDLIDSDGNLDYDRISSFSVADYAMLLTYSRQSPIEGLDIGGSIKIIRRLVGKFASAWGFGIDVAGRYSVGSWTFGVVMRDATSTFNVWQFNEENLVIEVGDSIYNRPPDNSLELTIPRIYLGVSRVFELTGRLSLLTEFNASVAFEGRSAAILSSGFAGAEPVAGLELNYGNLVFFRAGVGNVQRIAEFGGRNRVVADPSAGLGLQLGNFQLDYSMSNISPQTISLYSNIFSVKYIIGGE